MKSIIFYHFIIIINIIIIEIVHELNTKKAKNKRKTQYIFKY